MSDRLFNLVCVVLIAAIVLTLALFIFVSVRERSECRSKGGRMVHDGTFTYIAQLVGKVTVLTPHPNYKCEVPS